MLSWWVVVGSGLINCWLLCCIVCAAAVGRVICIPTPPPPGRLINRFTKDTEALDTQMAYAVNSALACLVGVVLSIAAVAAVSPWILLFLLPLSALYYRVQLLYIKTSRELKRLDAVRWGLGCCAL